VRPRIGVALGSGSARGWAHIAVLRELERRGIYPDIVCGSSVGALVGGAYASGQLDELEQWVTQLTWRDVVSLMDISLEGGLISGRKLLDHMEKRFGDVDIGHCHPEFAAVATDYQTGTERWLREGPLLEAVRASIALPGLFSPYRYQGRLMIDGGMVNPVPVSLCRALGAEVIIAVDLNSDLLTRFPAREADNGQNDLGGKEEGEGLVGRILGRFKGSETQEPMPRIADVMARSVNIMAVRLTRTRMAGDPPDVLIQPRLAHIGLMDYHKANKAFTGAREAVKRAADELDQIPDDF